MTSTAETRVFAWCLVQTSRVCTRTFVNRMALFGINLRLKHYQLNTIDPHAEQARLSFYSQSAFCLHHLSGLPL